MKAFSLEEYLKNPSKKRVTMNGRNVRIICTDMKAQCYPIVALIQDNNRELEILATYTKDGVPAEYTVYYTLYFAPERHEKWINIYCDTTGVSSCAVLYDSREEAEEVGKSYEHYVATAKVEWEE